MYTIDSVGMPPTALAALLLIFITPDASGQLQCDLGQPHPEAPAELSEFAFTIGHWSIAIHEPVDGGVRTRPERAYWTAKYILDGFAIQDEFYSRLPWLTDVTPGRGTNVRMFKEDHWEVVWQHTARPGFEYFHAQRVGEGELLMQRMRSDGTVATGYRVRFLERDEDRWESQDEHSEDGGETWRTGLRFEATRLPCNA